MTGWLLFNELKRLGTKGRDSNPPVSWTKDPNSPTLSYRYFGTRAPSTPSTVDDDTNRCESREGGKGG